MRRQLAAHERSFAYTLPSIPVTKQHQYSPYNTVFSVEGRENIKLPQLTKKQLRMEMQKDSDLRVLVYDTLEQQRASKIGVKPLRNFNVTRTRRSDGRAQGSRHSLPALSANVTPVAPVLQPLQPHNESLVVGLTRSNTIAPFGTMAPKPTCGFYFNRETMNKKVRIGVPPSDLVKWRSDYAQYAQKQG